MCSVTLSVFVCFFHFRMFVLTLNYFQDCVRKSSGVEVLMFLDLLSRRSLEGNRLISCSDGGVITRNPSHFVL